MTAPGWYNAAGDPPNTTRYWDGERWIGDPVHTPQAPSTPAYNAGYSGGYSGGYSTGQPAGLNIAGAGARIGARLIDTVILLLLGVIFAFPIIREFVNGLDALGPNPTDAQMERLIEDAVEGRLVPVVIWIAIAGLWDLVWVAIAGATPGKLMLGLRVARADNGQTPPGIGKAILRWLNRPAGAIPIVGFLIFFVNLASLIMLFSDDQRRTVMDRIASTVVVKK